MNAKKITQLALLTAAGLVLFLFESVIPRPLPWIKPGLSQIATLVALYLFGWREALVVVGARVLLGSLLTGTFIGPGFWLALPAGMSAAVSMACTRSVARESVGMAGVSVIGALVHNLTQLALVRLFFVQSEEVIYLLPLVWLPAIFTGLIVGLASFLLIWFSRRAGIVWGT